MTDYYENNAAAFIEATRTVDMTAFHNRFLAALQPRPPANTRLLDAGAGSGRDARTFRLAGYRVEAFDASPAMVLAAAEFAAVPVRQLRFEDFAWDHPFEGIWACASLLHVGRQYLPGALQRLADHLVSDGIIYASFKFGPEERKKNGRHFTDMTEDTLASVLDDCPALVQFETWRSSDQRPDKKHEIWLNALLKRK